MFIFFAPPISPKKTKAQFKVFLSLLAVFLLSSCSLAAETKETPKTTTESPGFDKNNSAKGIILAFKRWPLSLKEQSAILKKAQSYGLNEKAKYPIFKSWVFEWPKEKKSKEALTICESFASFSNILDYCEPDFFLSPARGKSKKKTKPPEKGIKLESKPVSSGSGDLKSCHIIPAKLGLKGGQLSDYWAQEMVGADLVREELKKAPPIKKHLVSVFDSPERQHDLGVKNLISSSGKQATLPEIGQSLTMANAIQSSYYLQHSSHFLNTAKQKCSDKKANALSLKFSDRG